MEAPAFRRDPWLRASAYHLATWSVAAFVLDRAFSAPGPASPLAPAVAVIGGSLLASHTHERRVGKMCGVAGESLDDGAPRRWVVLVLLMAAGTLVLAALGRGDLRFAWWVGLVGGGLVAWGRRAGFGWYLGLGVVLVAAAVGDLALGAAGGGLEGPSAGIGAGPGSLPAGLAARAAPSRWAYRAAVLLALVPAAALVTNRRFLWWRSPSA